MVNLAVRWRSSAPPHSLAFMATSVGQVCFRSSVKSEHKLQYVLWSLIRFPAGAKSRGFYVNPFQVAVQSAVACSQTEDGSLFLAEQLVEGVLLWIVSSIFVSEVAFVLVFEEGFDFLVAKI